MLWLTSGISINNKTAIYWASERTQEASQRQTQDRIQRTKATKKPLTHQTKLLAISHFKSAEMILKSNSNTEAITQSLSSMMTKVKQHFQETWANHASKHQRKLKESHLDSQCKKMDLKLNKHTPATNLKNKNWKTALVQPQDKTPFWEETAFHQANLSTNQSKPQLEKHQLETFSSMMSMKLLKPLQLKNPAPRNATREQTNSSPLMLKESQKELQMRNTAQRKQTEEFQTSCLDSHAKVWTLPTVKLD